MVQYGFKGHPSSTILTLAIILLVIIVLVKFVKWRLSRQRLYKLANLMHKFPLTSVPLIGHSYHFIGDNEQILETILKLINSPSPSAIWIGPVLVVHISRPADLEKVLNSPFAVTKSYRYNFVKDIVGDSIFVATGSKWKKHKKLILPTFKQKILDSFVEVFVRHINTLLEILETKKSVTDLTEVIPPCALDIVCETVMGIELNAQRSYCKFAKYLQRVMDIVAIRIFNCWLHPSFIYHLTPMCYEQKNIIRYIQKFTKDVVAKKRENINNNSKRSSEDKSNKNKIFLEYFLEMSNSGNTLTEQEIVDGVNTLLVGGIDTSATVSSFVLVMLAMFPEIQQRVYEEIIDVVGVDREVESLDLSKMVYLERVIKETMRIFPIGPLVGRTAEEDIKLEKHTIPKGAEIALTIISTHRNPEYFKDPLKFDPDRFLPEEVSKRHPYAYLPFTAGIRKCIGTKFAYMFMKTLLSKVVRKFTLTTPYKSIEEIRLKESLVLRTVNGFPIQLKPRN